MQFIFEYILKCSLSLGVVYLFYWLVLRKLTFYTWNRWYLLLFTLFSFLVPFINISSVLSSDSIGDYPVINSLPAFHPVNTGTQENSFTGNAILLSGWNIAAMIIVAGIIVLLIRFAIQLLSFKKILRQAALVANDGIKLYEVNRDVIPFSFGRSVFINRKFHSAAELSEIIKHELVHIKQMHTIDILWGELLCIMNWFNPFAWLIRKAIRQNLEFIADDNVLRDGAGKKQYQYLLLKVSGNYHYSIAHSFNYSSLKKRIAMMNKMKTARLQLVRFLFMLPLMVGMLILFRSEVQSQVSVAREPVVKEKASPASIVVTDTIPKATIKKAAVSKPSTSAPAKTVPVKPVPTLTEPVLVDAKNIVTTNTSNTGDTQVSVNANVSVKVTTDRSSQ